MTRLLTFLALAIGLMAQQTNSVYTFTANPPQAVTGLSLSLVGPQGSGTYYYWVSATYPIGHTFPAGPVQISNAPSTLTSGNFVRVNWVPTTGALGYTVFRTTTATFPQSGTCACAVIVGTANTTVSDIGGGLSTVTLNPTQGATTVEFLDNMSMSSKRLVIDTESNIPSVTLGPFSFGSLPTNGRLTSIGGTPLLDGKVTYCVDCQQTNPCLGGGTGAVAERINGIWSCTSGGAAGGGGTPAPPLFAIQTNQPLGTFAGDASFTAQYNNTDFTFPLGITLMTNTGMELLGVPDSSLNSFLQPTNKFQHGQLNINTLTGQNDSNVGLTIQSEGSGASFDAVGFTAVSYSLAGGLNPSSTGGFVQAFSAANGALISALQLQAGARAGALLVNESVLGISGTVLSGGATLNLYEGITISDSSFPAATSITAIRLGQITGVSPINTGISIPIVNGGTSSNTGLKIGAVTGTVPRAIQTAVQGDIVFGALTVTGAATGKNVVCVDTATGKLYASSTGTDCSN